MRTRAHLLVTAAAALGLGAAGPAAALGSETSIACDGGIVRLGDAKLDLLAKCGPPSLEDAREVDVTRLRLDRDGQGASVRQARLSIEEWSYNFGPNRFVMHVRLERGKVVAIERGGYGYTPARSEPTAPTRPRCEPSALRVGDAKLDLLAKCGEPALRERAEQRAPTVATAASPPGALAAVEVEVWTYDFGPQQLVRFVTLEDGRVASVETGSYGYAP
jgi:uncharacterized protein DUF2845